ncbi:MAG: type VI secretion system domain-containing protein [Candidatus Manganitrophus sp.]|nr:type VI secretion system domain-containing protein [Candidatus Manganitrophus sp.]WDT71880.1 MAG: type VI secretion system domain-containing protein [Candidatus Manganitrophus sp.]
MGQGGRERRSGHGPDRIAGAKRLDVGRDGRTGDLFRQDRVDRGCRTGLRRSGRRDPPGRRRCPWSAADEPVALSGHARADLVAIRRASGSYRLGDPHSGPPSHLVESGRLLVEQRGWKDLVDQVEAQLPENPFWLDLQRLSALALSNLGSSYAGIKSAVLGEVRILLQRLPDLPRCRFADGTPFADDETQQWIEKEVLSGGNGPSKGAGEGSAADARIAETRAQANQLLGQGEAKGAVALFQERINGAASRRERFLLQLELAQLCLDAGHPKVALSQLDALQREIDRFSLEEWEPALSLEVLRVSWRVLNRLSRDSDPGSPEWAVRAEAIYGRISRLDPVSALELDRK